MELAKAYCCWNTEVPTRTSRGKSKLLLTIEKTILVNWNRDDILTTVSSYHLEAIPVASPRQGWKFNHQLWKIGKPQVKNKFGGTSNSWYSGEGP
jgi:hypothetical protein